MISSVLSVLYRTLPFNPQDNSVRLSPLLLTHTLNITAKVYKDYIQSHTVTTQQGYNLTEIYWTLTANGKVTFV